MPSRPARVCNHCRRAVPAGQRCACRPERKPFSSNNGYAGSGSTRRWRKLRDAKLAANPLCETRGCRRLAAQVDHIVNVGAGGDRYDWQNLQSLCKPHHAAKTAHEATQARRSPHQG